MSEPQDTAIEAASGASTKQQQKKQKAAMAALAGELAAELSSSAAVVDQHLGAAAPEQRAWAKAKRRQLRELITSATDPTKPLEERVRTLQAALASEVSGHIASEQRVVAADQRAQAAEAAARAAEAKAAERAELALKLEEYCRAAEERTAETQAVLASWKARALEVEGRMDGFKENLDGLQRMVEQSLTARNELIQENTALRAANDALQRQVGALQKYRDEDQERMKALDDLKAKIEAQAEAHKGLQSVQVLLEDAVKERAVLAAELEAKTVEAAQLREAVGKAKSLIDLQEQAYAAKVTSYEKELAGLSKSFKSTGKLIAELSKQNEALPTLLAHTKQLEQQLAAAQSEAARAGAQRDKLESLCRVLRGQGPATAAGEPEAEAAEDVAGEDAAEQQQQQQQEHEQAAAEGCGF